MKEYCVYILASKENGTLYVGVTSNLAGRIYQHRNNLANGFTKKYGVHTLVYYEIFDSVEHAIRREKRVKKYPRRWKLNLINSMNPNWKDLYASLFGLPE